ncbi:DUF421 domain-containing protein [Bacillus pinisoli]|uniref:DUF421 domain-containing protein n=1 Tax=Bacillus pinisoli TaxID=2901866 RepID=UPI001FF225C8|nr:DUF421 domain-containing protein [Bacillus pinisoli]
MPEWLLIIVRSISILIGLFFILKLLGKKQLSELSFFETIVGITIGDIAGSLSMDIAVSYLHGGIAIIIWASIPYLFDIIAVKSKKFRDFVEGKSTVFIKNGKVLEENLKKEKISADELLEMLRKKDIFRVADVEFASFEPTGDLSVLRKKQYQPLSVGDVVEEPQEEKEPKVVIMDGDIVDESLSQLNLDRSWLHKEAKKRGLKVDDIYLAQIDGNQNQHLHLDLYDDQDQEEAPHPQHSKRLYATLKKCQAELELLGLQTNDQSIQTIMHHQATQMQQLIQTLEPHLNGVRPPLR